MTLLEVSKVDGLVPRYGSVEEAAAALGTSGPAAELAADDHSGA